MSKLFLTKHGAFYSDLSRIKKEVSNDNMTTREQVLRLILAWEKHIENMLLFCRASVREEEKEWCKREIGEGMAIICNDLLPQIEGGKKNDV